MKKGIVVPALIGVIIVSFGFALLKFSSLGNENNFFNSELRSRFAASPLAREMLNLNWDGDAKSDYLGIRYPGILIEVDRMDGLRPANGALELLKEKIQEATGKPTAYILSDSSVPYSDKTGTEDLAVLEGLFRDFYSGADQAVIYLLYAGSDAEEEDVLGSTFEEDGIILFKDELKDFTSANPELLHLYEASTALHEFGHQLGLPHNDEFGCLMNEHAEESYVTLTAADEVITDFCEFEKEIIATKRAQL